ncbi:MAG: XdhC family protein, partial [Verrucomicrobiota bacterium]
NDRPPGVFIGGREWHSDEALVLVSRSFAIDREALGAALQNPGAGYVGMIGSRKKIRQVFSDLEKEGASREAFDQVRAPIGLDIRADSPAEIAVSVIAEVLSVLRGGTGCPLTDRNR